MEDIIVDDDRDATQQVLRPDYQHDDHHSSGQNLHVRNDFLDIESRSFPDHIGHASKKADWSVILLLAFQSFGIVYGDLGTSPLYVFAGVFPDGIKHDDDILGVLSLIFYTITLLPMIKYVFIVLQATDNGHGGTFALYSLICRYAKVGLIQNQQAEDTDVSNFQLDLPNNSRMKRASRIKLGLENSHLAKMFLFLATMLSTSMVIGDGVLTPCISVNYLLMLACIGVIVGFKTTTKISNAYGIAVVFVMTLTSSFLVLIMIIIWKTNIFLVISFIVIIGSVELLYLSSVLYKFDQGGYLPLAFAALLMTIMYVWNNVYRRKYNYELDHIISPERLSDMMAVNSNLNRLPGLAMFYSELVQEFHWKSDFYFVAWILNNSVFRCVVRYGYVDVRNEKEDFEKIMIEKLKEFISNNYTANEGDIDVIDRASRVGVVHLMGESEILAGKTAGIGKKILIDYAYNFLKKNLTPCDKMLGIPRKRMLKISMTYEL
ncbi:Potassium transporter [Quillaja saponaria]|uniref:Potassium transporter n=1 Tax=Quillaja saponaria TaxID=32244 RepID=A0AAD7M2G9_QUISA|nr:Potassium transporter [Quillaja saponaria]